MRREASASLPLADVSCVGRFGGGEVLIAIPGLVEKWVCDESGQNIGDHFTMDIGQAERATVVHKGELFVV